MADITSNLTARDLSVVEKLTGIGMGHWQDTSMSQGELFAAIAFVIVKRTDPSATYQQMLDKSLNDLTALLGIEDDDEPTDEPTEAAEGSELVANPLG